MQESVRLDQLRIVQGEWKIRPGFFSHPALGTLGPDFPLTLHYPLLPNFLISSIAHVHHIYGHMHYIETCIKLQAPLCWIIMEM